MPLFRFLGLLAIAIILGAQTSPPPVFNPTATSASDWPAQGGQISVMTYNVKGLPWPAASNRVPALAAIGERLRRMRMHGVQPHVVLLQEAFVRDAKRIGQFAGYRHMAFGPTDAAITGRAPLGSEFAADAQWAKGERIGSVLDSGLVVLSDYPIVKSRRYAFPQGACAGFDCLAAKGVLVTWVDVPGAGEPIAVVDTHLNSRHATHVSADRADEAYDWQLEAVRRLLSNAIATGTPVILGGDFNVGQAKKRKAALAVGPMIGVGETNDLATVLSDEKILPGAQVEVRSIVARNKDRLLSLSGDHLSLKPVRAWVPFRMATAENPMSDHAGFVIDYNLDKSNSGIVNQTYPPKS